MNSSKPGKPGSGVRFPNRRNNTASGPDSRIRLATELKILPCSIAVTATLRQKETRLKDLSADPRNLPRSQILRAIGVVIEYRCLDLFILYGPLTTSVAIL